MQARWLARASVFGIVLAAMSPTAVSDDAPVGSTIIAIGTLTIVRGDGAQEQLQGRKLLPLYDADIVTTDVASQAYLQFSDGINLAMNEPAAVEAK